MTSGRPGGSSPATLYTRVTSTASSMVSAGMMLGRRRASMVLPAPGGPLMSTLWPPATAISSTRFTVACPMMSAKSCAAAVPWRSMPATSAGGCASPPPAARLATACVRVATGYTSRPSTSEASAALAAGASRPRTP